MAPAHPLATNNFLIPNGTFFFELILFLIVLYIIGKYVVPRLNDVIEERQRTIQQQFDDAEAAKSRLEKAEADYKEALAETRRESSRLREEAAADKAAIIEEARDAARGEAAEIVERAQAQVAAERQQAINALRAEVGELAFDLAEKLVHTSLREQDRQRQLVSDFIAGVQSGMQAEEGASGVTPGRPAGAVSGSGATGSSE
jgi:F-type H+-transporting ATPase subunit b